MNKKHIPLIPSILLKNASPMGTPYALLHMRCSLCVCEGGIKLQKYRPVPSMCNPHSSL